MIDDATYKKRYRVANWILKTEREFGDITNEQEDRWSDICSRVDDLFTDKAKDAGLEEPIKRKSYEARMVMDMLFRLEDFSKQEGKWNRDRKS